MYKATFIIDA